VLEALEIGLTQMDSLAKGMPHINQSGGTFIGWSAKHLYPGVIATGGPSAPVEVRQGDPYKGMSSEPAAAAGAAAET
jgi:hypothetical protein